MHGLGIVHCDIRPKNFLVDEHGIVKFSNFKYARKVSKIAVAMEDITSKGYPPYLAPELFSPNGVHSYYSDFWSFGCILYVFRRGCLPWPEDLPAEAISKMINQKSFFDVDEALPSMSAELVDVISWLVEKPPYHRCSWYAQMHEYSL
jgi:serine/threonine protein kinase